MKKILYTLLLATLCVNSGCSDFLDREPKTTLSPGTFWKTESDLRLALNILYQNMNRSYTLDSHPLKSAHLRDIARKQYLADSFNK